VNGGIIVKYK